MDAEKANLCNRVRQLYKRRQKLAVMVDYVHTVLDATKNMIVWNAYPIDPPWEEFEEELLLFEDLIDNAHTWCFERSCPTGVRLESIEKQQSCQDMEGCNPPSSRSGTTIV